MYPLDGNRFVPGTDPAHLGGDGWVADAGMEMMDKENWSGMLLTLGGIDKASHMWGGITDTTAAGPTTRRTSRSSPARPTARSDGSCSTCATPGSSTRR